MDKNTLWLNNVSTKLVSKNSIKGKTYKTKEGKEVTPELKFIALNMGTNDDPIWRNILVDARRIIPSKNSDGTELKNKVNIAISKDYKYVLSYSVKSSEGTYHTVYEKTTKTGEELYNHFISLREDYAKRGK